MGVGLLNNELIDNIRKDLLIRNLSSTYESNIGGVSSLASSRGTPYHVNENNVGISVNANNVQSLGEIYLNDNTFKNKYTPTEFGIYTTYDLNDVTTNVADFADHVTYSDYYRKTLPDFELRSSIANIALGNEIVDTPIGTIGREQLRFAVEENVAYLLQKETIGRVNTNILSILNGKDIFVKDHTISKLPGGLGFIVNSLEKVTGVEIPIDIVPKSAYGFLDSRLSGKLMYDDCGIVGLEGLLDTDQRNNELLRYSGRGNKRVLFDLLGINRYRPNYEGELGLLGERKGNLYDGRLDKTRRHSGPLPVMQKLGLGSKPFTGKKDDIRSVLQENGTPKIVWDSNDRKAKSGSFKRFMLSIENLAWIGNTEGLMDCEVGNGDRDSSNPAPGRIMWFPPYDLSFDENVSVAWEATNFIGRTEPIYTYNNVRRSGTLSFKVVVDHPSILAETLKNSSVSDKYITDFFKGCTNIDDYLLLLNTISDRVETEKITEVETHIITEMNKVKEQTKNSVITPESISYKIYFPNASYSIDASYESGVGASPTQVSPGISGITTEQYANRTDFSLNITGDGYLNPSLLSEFDNLTASGTTIGEGSVKVIINVGCTSAGGNPINSQIGPKRYEAAKAHVISKLGSKGISEDKIVVSGSKACNSGAVTCPEVGYRDCKEEKESRYASIEIKYDVVTDTISETEVDDPINIKATATMETITKITKRALWSECDYFDYLEKEVPLLYQSLAKKLRYFSPAFHSTTPEGLNSRLTFLHQCTRPGPAISPKDKGNSNLAFGRPPICILRIGDFFHTKMVIDSLNISYEEKTWDLNPEGIGVQPMIATVRLSVNYIGGHSLDGPVKELQNALSINMYANTEVFLEKPRVISRESTTYLRDTIFEYPAPLGPTFDPQWANQLSPVDSYLNINTSTPNVNGVINASDITKIPYEPSFA